MLFLCLTALLDAAKALPSPSPSEPAAPADDSGHACGNLIREASENGYAPATEVYECWKTVPFNPAVGTRFIKYLNDTIQFQSTLEYLKQPPPGYQQPAVDLVAGLNDIQNTINLDGFANQYQFEAAVQSLLFSAHDAHVGLDAGLLSSFKFGLSHGLSSVSVDGIELPKIYLTDDIEAHQTGAWNFSAISQINGVDIVEYLTRFAALNSFGTVEPHADWNLLFENAVVDVLDAFTPLWTGATTFYPGEKLKYTFENGTTFEDEWLAVYLNFGDTGPLETGGDFYNFFVLGFYPDSYNVSSDVPGVSTGTNSSSYPEITFFNNPAFPRPDVWQENLTETGYTTGYFLRDQSLAVLSVPTFFAFNDAIRAFLKTVDDFLTQAKAAGMSKVVIDLQQNEGGDLILAYSVFKLFFPNIDPFAGSNMREHPLANALGDTITGYFKTLTESDDMYRENAADEWIAITRLNAETGRNFTSWRELYSQIYDGVDSFTSTIRLNTSDSSYVYSALGGQDPPRVLLSPSSGDAPFAAENIIMLSDGLCGSTCALFIEMMHWDAGVKNVVVGGRPSHGPMQTPSGSRAARFYPLFEMDGDFDGAAAIGPEEDHVGDIVIPDRLNQDIFISDGGISLRNQVREGETIPLQMQFEAADCRIFYTFRTFNNFTNLWKHAADAMWKNPDLCVQGSTGFAKSKESTPRPAPAAETLPGVKYSHIGVPDLHHTDEDVDMPLFDQPLPNAGPRAMRPVATINELELYKQYKLKQGETIQQRPTHKPVPKHRLTTQKPTTCARAGPNCLNKRKVRWGV